MPPFDPLKAIGLVMSLRSDSTTAFLGSCFAFRQPHTFLTAAHCVGELPAAGLGIGLPFVSLQTVLPVKTAVRHPEADLALLTLAPDEAGAVEPFWNFVGNFTLGEEFFAFGYPEDVFGPTGNQPTPRLFKGYYQRYMYYQSPLGYECVFRRNRTRVPGHSDHQFRFIPNSPS